MNANEQKQRHTAVQTAERRIDDLETLLIELGADVFKDRAEHKRSIEELNARLRLKAFAKFMPRTFWQRLRWLVRGDV